MSATGMTPWYCRPWVFKLTIGLGCVVDIFVLSICLISFLSGLNLYCLFDLILLFFKETYCLSKLNGLRLMS